MKTNLFFVAILLGCGSKTETKLSDQDSLAVDSTEVTVATVSTMQTQNIKTVTQNFSGYITYTLTEDEREAKVWDALSPLLEQYDTTNFHTLSKNYTVPGTEETPDGTQNTIHTVTITLYYNDAQELKAFKKDDHYEVGSPEHFENVFTLYLFDQDLIAVYEDREVAIDMAAKNFTRGVVKACPDCGIYLSAGVSSSEVVVSGTWKEDVFTQWNRTARSEEAELVEYAYADSFGPSGDEYVYQTVEPMNEDADYEVFYTASKGYYEKFMKPKR